MSLDLSSLRKAILSLERACSYLSKRLNDIDAEDDEIEIIKAAVIKNFEFTYELCWKFMRRWLSNNYDPEYTNGVTRKQLFRLALENTLIEEFDNWAKYHELRNQTSHIYDRDIAENIFSEAENFLADAKALLMALETRND